MVGLRKKHGRVTSLEEAPRPQLREDGGGEDGRIRPELARKRQNRQSTYRMGRTIGEQRERLETRNERNAARKKDKRRQTRRVTFTVLGFVILAVVLVVLCFFFIGNGEPTPTIAPVEEPVSTEPTVLVIDEDAVSGSHSTNRMRSYIGQAEQDFRDLGLKPTKVVVPTGSIRTIHFYLDGYSGYIKMTIDRGTAVSAEDTERMLRYLAGQGINDFEYIDVRVDGKAFWK